MSFTIFTDRFSPEYQRFLAKTLGDLDELCRYANAPAKPKLEKGQFKKGIQLDFCGLSASTLLGVTIAGEKGSPLKKEIYEHFCTLLSTKTTDYLESKGIYLKVRFIFSYMYSSFSKSLIEAEASLSRPYVKDRKLKYDFKVFPPAIVENSTLYKTQVKSLEKLGDLADKNPHLVMTRPERANHTLQVRFSPIAMPLCVMVLNNRAFSDSYIYAQEHTRRSVHNLFYHYPIQVFDRRIKFQAKYYDYLTNHFDYQWNNDIVLLGKDATEFDLERYCEGLSRIRRPHELTWDQKEMRIRDHMNKHKMPYDREMIDKWRAAMTSKLRPYLVADPKMEEEKKGQRSSRPKSSSRPKPKKAAADIHKNSSLEIGKSKNEYFFRLLIPSGKIDLSYDNRKAEHVFQLLLHHAIAKVEGRRPCIHRYLDEGARVFRDIMGPLNNRCKTKIDKVFMFKYIFEQNREYELLIPVENIRISDNYKEWAKSIMWDKQNRVLQFDEELR